jgi:hypothetical protein
MLEALSQGYKTMLLCTQLDRGMPGDDCYVVSQTEDLKDARGHKVL